MIDKPLYENPLAGGQQAPFDLSKMNKNPYNSEFIGLGEDQTNLFGYKVPDYVIKEQEEYAKNNPINMYNMTLPGELGSQLIVDPNATAQKKADEEFLKTADEYQKGFRESEFYKPGGAMTADVAEFIYKSPTGKDITMKGSSSGIGQFGSYLDSIGKGDLLQRVGGGFSQDLLGKVNPDVPYDLAGAKQGLFPIKNEKGEDIGGIENTAIATVQDPLGGNYTKSVQPIVTGPDMFEIATQQTPSENNFFETTGQYLTGPDESNDIIETLKNIEQGIASLGGNFGQEGNMNQSSNYGDFKNFGIGSFFPPYGGMYG
tara:strand:- start:225 stop:1172 length:948 start_codon:yes stop_codon:yes gene_type:complete